MEGKTHLVGGLTISTIAFNFSYTITGHHADNLVTYTSLYFLGAIIGSLILDIDHVRSKIGLRFKTISHIISLLSGHRTLTHSLTFLVGLFYLFNFLEINKIFQLGFYIGSISHILLDMLTSHGVCLLYPFSDIRFKIMKLRTGKKTEKKILKVSKIILLISLIDVFLVDVNPLLNQGFKTWKSNLTNYFQIILTIAIRAIEDLFL